MFVPAFILIQLSKVANIGERQFVVEVQATRRITTGTSIACKPVSIAKMMIELPIAVARWPLINKRTRIPIRPSFTGIVLEIEEAPIISPTLGVVPGQIRGLRTGLAPPRRKKKKKVKKKKKKR